MSKRKKNGYRSNAPQPTRKSSAASNQLKQPAKTSAVRSQPATTASASIVQPEQMSLMAYRHVQNCLGGKTYLEKEAVTSILRLSQHLRVFGLLSAVGYLNQPKSGEVQKWVKPIWTQLLWQLMFEEPLSEGSEKEGQENRHNLMEHVQTLARDNAPVYMTTWRRSLLISNHWNFWARAHQQDFGNGSATDSKSTD